MTILDLRNEFEVLLIKNIKFKTPAIISLNRCNHLTIIMRKSYLNKIIITSVIWWGLGKCLSNREMLFLLTILYSVLRPPLK